MGERTWWWWVLVAGGVPEAGDLGTWYSAAAAAEGAQSSPLDRERAHARGTGLGVGRVGGGGPLGRTGRAWAGRPDGTFFSSKALSNTRSPLAVRHGSFRQVSAAAGCLAGHSHDSRRWGFPDAIAEG